jgi:NitT/TauT family transport system substrate-binding protein
MTARLALALTVLLAACVTAPTRPLDTLRLQLKWVPQAQFAGYYAALYQDFYRDESLNVVFLPGGPDVVPEDAVARGRAEIGITWLPALLAAREHGLPLVNVAQVFAHSGQRQVALKASGIRNVGDLRGRKVSVWSGHEAPLIAALYRHAVAPGQITLFPQGLGMQVFVDRTIDSAAAMTYNELRQVWKAGVRPDQLLIIDWNAEGTATLEDGLFVSEAWLASPAHRDVASRFLRASLRGWAFCRHWASECLDALDRAAPGLDREHQTWMLNEVIKLIYGPPTPATQPGRMDPTAFARTVEVLLGYGLLERAPDAAAYTDVVWEEAQR